MQNTDFLYVDNISEGSFVTMHTMSEMQVGVGRRSKPALKSYV